MERRHVQRKAEGREGNILALGEDVARVRGSPLNMKKESTITATANPAPYRKQQKNRFVCYQKRIRGGEIQGVVSSVNFGSSKFAPFRNKVQLLPKKSGDICVIFKDRGDRQIVGGKRKGRSRKNTT